jgi:hypothetical protein
LTDPLGTVSSGTANTSVTKPGTVDGSEMVSKTYSINDDLLDDGDPSTDDPQIGTGNITVTAWPQASRFHGVDNDFIINSSDLDTMGALTPSRPLRRPRAPPSIPKRALSSTFRAARRSITR